MGPADSALRPRRTSEGSIAGLSNPAQVYYQPLLHWSLLVLLCRKDHALQLILPRHLHLVQIHTLIPSLNLTLIANHSVETMWEPPQFLSMPKTPRKRSILARVFHFLNSGLVLLTQTRPHLVPCQYPNFQSGQRELCRLNCLAQHLLLKCTQLPSLHPHPQPESIALLKEISFIMLTQPLGLCVAFSTLMLTTNEGQGALGSGK